MIEIIKEKVSDTKEGDQKQILNYLYRMENQIQ